MAEFGLTDDGFNKRTLSDIKDLIDEKMIAAFGSPNLAADAVFGQVIGVVTEVVSELWDLGDKVYGSQYALSALGISLDAVAELNNLKRLDATSATGLVILEGTEGTIVPQGTQFGQNNTTEIFETDAVVTLDVSVLQKAVISVNDFATQPHTITLDKTEGTPASEIFTSTVITSALDVLNDFQTKINAVVPQTQLAVVDEIGLTITITNLDLTSKGTFGIALDATLDIDEQWSPVVASSVNKGVITMEAFSIQQVITTVAGLNSVDNLAVGTEGTAVETDAEFRARRKESIKVVGAASVPAMEARLVNELAFITAATVKDNRTSAEVDGVPAHGIKAILTGGDDGDPAIVQAIVDKIWQIKSGGIQTSGAVSGTVIDSTGQPQIIFYARSIKKYIHFNIEYTLYSEEIFPPGGEDSMKTALVAFGETLGTNDDVIRQRFFSSIYSVSGVKNITLFECAVTENELDTPTVVGPETITGEPTAGTYDLSGATLIASGIVSGMVVQDSTDPLKITTVQTVVSETQFIAVDDVFSVSDTLNFGGFGSVDIAIKAEEIAQFTTTNIAIQEQP